MKIRAISPLFPSVVLNIDENLDVLNDFIDVWHMICRRQKPKICELEVELCECSYSRSKFFDLSTPLDSVLKDCTKEPVLFSIGLKRLSTVKCSDSKYEVEINYLIVGVSEEINTGKIKINTEKCKTVEAAIGYIVLRHSLLYNLDIKIDPLGYLVQEYSQDANNSIGNIPFNDSPFQILDKRMSLQQKEQVNIILRSEITLICRKYPKEMKVSLSPRDINESEKILHLIRTVCGEEVVALGDYEEEVASLADLKSLIEKGWKYPIVHLEAEEEKMRRINEYRNAAKKIANSSEWESFFLNLQGKVEDSWLFFVPLPKRCGKTQLAYNLSYHYFVIYFDLAILHRIDYSVTSEAARGLEMLSSLIKEQRHESLLCSFLDQLFTHCLSSNYYTESPRLVNFVEILSNFECNLEKKMSLAELRHKYTSDVFNSFLFFFDNYDQKFSDGKLNGYDVSRIVRLLGAKVIYTSLPDSKYEFPKFVAPNEFKGNNLVSFMAKPFPFLFKFYKHTIDETILLQRFMEQTIGEEARRKLFFNFLMEQIASSVPLVSQTIIEFLLNMIGSTKEPIPFVAWRDKLLQSVIEYLSNAFSEFKIPLLGTFLGPQESADESPRRNTCHIGGDIKSVLLWDARMDDWWSTYVPVFEFEDNVVAYFYDCIENTSQCAYPVWDRFSLMKFIRRLNMTPKNGIQKKSLNEFIVDIIRAIDSKCQRSEFFLNLPNYLMSAEIPLFPPVDCTWPDCLYNFFPNMLAELKVVREYGLYEKLYTFEYYDNDQLKAGQIVIHCQPEYSIDFDLCIRFCEARALDVLYDANKTFSDILMKLSRRVNEIESCLGELSASPCECCFNGYSCAKCKDIEEYIEEMVRIYNYVDSTLQYGLQCTRIYRSKDINKLKKLIKKAKKALLWWESRGKPNILGTYLDPNGANIWLLVEDCDGKYHFEEIHTEEETSKVVLILPILCFRHVD